MARSRLLVRGVTLFALAFALINVVWSLVPAERWLPKHMAYAVAGQGCPSAGVYVHAATSAAAGGVMVPIVMAEHEDVGRTNGLATASCDMMAEAVRREAWWLRAVPRRFICKRVRSWAKELYVESGTGLGPMIWIVDGEVVHPLEVYEAVTGLGLQFRRTGIGYELVALDNGD